MFSLLNFHFSFFFFFPQRPKIELHGPWGNYHHPLNWHLQLNSFEAIREVTIRHGSIVNGIIFVIKDSQTGITINRAIGGTGGSSDTVQMRPNENITNLSGKFGRHCLGSITIHTNLKPDGYGPYGGNDTMDLYDFSSSLQSGCAVVGLCGRADKYVESIGLYAEVKVERLGPWGNLDKPQNWSLELDPYEVIKEITIQHGFILDGINFVIEDSRTGRTTSNRFGGPGGSASQILMSPNEVITNISGTYGLFTFNGQWLVGSIKIHTNLNPDGYGRYGSNTTMTDLQEFSSPLPSGYAIAGFHGRAGMLVENVGVYVKMGSPYPPQWQCMEVDIPNHAETSTNITFGGSAESSVSQKIEKRGPWGANLDNPLNWHLELGPNEAIKTVTIRHGFIVDGIKFLIEDSITGKTTSRKFGGTGGSPETIQMRPYEIITNISGIHGLFTHDGQWLIGSINIHTNLNPGGYGPYGSNTKMTSTQGFYSSLPSGCAIAGFHGRAGIYVENIGVYVKMKIEKYGPWGSPYPPNWNLDLAPHETIKAITIQHGFIIDGIEFSIEDNHTKRITNRSFGGTGISSHEIKLRQNESLTNISGTYGLYTTDNDHQHVASITIHTNLKASPNGYGPYGREENCENITHFSSSLPSGCDIAGFFGRAGQYLDCIGVYGKRHVD